MKDSKILYTGTLYVVILSLSYLSGGCFEITDKCEYGYIVAGEKNDLCTEITDIVPDTTLSPVWKDDRFDLDLDSIEGFDLIFEVKSGISGGANYSWRESRISSANDHLEFLVGQDTNYMKIINIGDTISNDDTWSGMKNKMIGYSLYHGSETMVSMNTNLTDNYIGIRIGEDSGKKLFWIRLDNESNYFLTIKEYGGNKK